MTKHANKGVQNSTDATDEHVEDDGSKGAQVGEEEAEETAVSSRGVEAAGVAVEERRAHDAFDRACGMCGLSRFWSKRFGREA